MSGRNAPASDLEKLGLARLAEGGDAGVTIFTDATIIEWREPIMAAALRHRLPTVCSQWFEWATAGCILTYGEDWAAMRRGAALQVVKVLRGAKPAEYSGRAADDP